MRAGETDKSRSVKRDDVFELVEHVLDGTGLIGPLDFDLFDVDGTLYLSEINPRFGGGYRMRMNVASIFESDSKQSPRANVIPDASERMVERHLFIEARYGDAVACLSLLEQIKNHRHEKGVIRSRPDHSF